MMRNWVVSLLFLGYFLPATAQEPTLGGYANVDNNLNKVPRIFFGITPGAEFRQGISIRPGAHLKIRGDRFGEIQLTGTFTPETLVKVPKEPFGPTYRCNCADNSSTEFKEADLSYTYYFKEKEQVKNYRIGLKGPSIKSEFPFITKGESEKLSGQVKHFYGIRLGGAYQQGTFYQLSTKRTLAYSGYEQRVAYLGFSRTNIGRMYRNVDGFGIKGKNIHSQFYADAFYAIDQNFNTTAVELFDSSGKLRTEKQVSVPYGFRVGATSCNYGFRSRFALYTAIEAGVRPTFNDLANGVYITAKIGFGIGFGKTHVYYISNSQNTVSGGKQANLAGNGKYKDRGFLGRSLFKRKPYKMIRHRYGK